MAEDGMKFRDAYARLILENNYKFGAPWYILRFYEPETFIAQPSTLDITYLNQTTIVVGAINESTGEYKSLMDYEYNSLFPVEEFVFSLEVPDYVPEGAFIGIFDPPILLFRTDGEVKTELTIRSNIPRDVALPENIILRINVTKFTTAGNLYRPPYTLLKVLLDKNVKFDLGKTIDLILGRYFGFFWTLYASLNILGNPFGKLYSGKRLQEETIYVDLVVKLDRFHLAEIIPPQPIEIGPDELISVPLEVKNLGSETDSFNFRAYSDPDSELIISSPPVLTIDPEDIGYTSIAVASPQIFNDPGTAHSIYIEAYSIYDPDKIFTNTVIVTTRGIYVSEVGWFYGALIAPFILLGIAFILYRRRRLTEKLIQKPKKPWTLPEEQEYLEELKKKDKEEYENVRLMMEDEYKSALLWYKDYRKYILKKEIKRKPSLKTLFKKSEKKQKKKPKYNFAKLFEKSEKKVEKPKKVEPEIIETKEEDQIKKEQALLRIKREQEKQKKKLKLA
jgi:hypothetical protein